MIILLLFIKFVKFYLGINIYLQIPETKSSIIALSPSVFLVSIASVLKGYFNGRENINITAHSQSLEQIFKTVFTIIVVECIGKISLNNTTLMAAGAAIATTLATLRQCNLFVQMFFTKKKEHVARSHIFKKI